MPLEERSFYRLQEEDVNYRLEMYSYSYQNGIRHYWHLCRWSDVGKKWVMYFHRNEQIEQFLKNAVRLVDDKSIPEKEAIHIEFDDFADNGPLLTRIQPGRHEVMAWHGDVWRYIGPHYSARVRLGDCLSVSELGAVKILKDTTYNRDGIKLTDEEANQKLFESLM